MEGRLFVNPEGIVTNLYSTGDSFFSRFQNFFRGITPVESAVDPAELGMRVSFRSDKASLVRFQREVLKKCFHEYDLEPERYFNSKVRSGDYVVLLVEEGAEILGGIVIEHSWSMGKKIMLIAWVAVNEKHRGRDIGTLLVDEAISYAKANEALVLVGEVENPEKFKAEESAFGDPVKRVKFYSRFDCKRLEVPYVVQVCDGTEELGMMLTLFPLSAEQASATEISLPEFALFIEELVEMDETEASDELIRVARGVVHMTSYRDLYGF